MRFLYLLVITLLFSSCSQEDNRIIPSVQTFIKLSTATTGITFNNEIQETQTRNHFLWPSIYNGGGVGVCDINNDGLINEDDKTYIGDPIPDVTMGLNISFDYKNFDFQMYLFSSIGNEIVRNYERNLSLTNKTSYELERWTGPGTSNSVPRATTGATSNAVFSDYFVEDASYVRAQNLQIGYTLDKNSTKKIGVEKLRFYASVSNVFTLTKYRGYDPTSSNGSPIGSGFDPGFYPTPRTYLLGANIKL